MVTASVNVLIRDVAGRTFLQMRDGDAASAPFQWGFWGGRVEASDLSVEHAAARELAEELDISTLPNDFARLDERLGSDGHRAALLLFQRPLGWRDFDLREGAGAGFFWKRDLLYIPVVKAVAWYLLHRSDLFADCQA